MHLLDIVLVLKLIILMRLKEFLKLFTFLAKLFHRFQSLLLTHLSLTPFFLSLLSYPSKHCLVISSSLVLATNLLLEFLLFLLHALDFTDGALLISTCLPSLNLQLVSKSIDLVSIELTLSSQVSDDSISSLLLSFHLFQIIVLLLELRLSIF